MAQRQKQRQAGKQPKQKQKINPQNAQMARTKAELTPFLEAAQQVGSLEALPDHSTSHPMHHATVLQLQHHLGNAHVQRMLTAQCLLKAEPSRPEQGGQPLKGTHTPLVIQRGEAPVHEGIEKTATEGVEADILKQMYVGNWMRDFSQLNLPMPHSIAQKLPKKIDKPTGETIGPAGAEDIITAVIRALAFLHFGPEITNQLVTPENIGAYTPEQHVDNPMGTTAADHLVRDRDSGLLRRGVPEFTTENAKTAPVEVHHEDPDRDEQLKGKAFPGLQVENPDLYKVSDAGLTNHIYNAIEYIKEQLFSATSAGRTPEGRMHLGSALHGVEDYFAHSNFIEVALNSEIGRALKSPNGAKKPPYSPNFLKKAQENKTSGGAFVDTLYDARSPGGRMAVTTGTAGAEDLKVSIGQIVLPKLPALAAKINQKIDEAFNLVVASEGQSSWEKIQAELKKDEGGWATLEVLNALDRHIQVPVYDIDVDGPDIPFTDRFIPTRLRTDQFQAGAATAIQHYIRLYKRIMMRFDELETAVHILFPITLLIDLRKQFVKLFNGYIEDLKKSIQRQVNEFLLSLVEEITGLDLKEEKKKGLTYALNVGAAHGVEHIRGKTSIEARLPEIMEETDPSTLWYAYGIMDGKPTAALPPSHSEISKDHPPHADDAQSGYDISEGSLFYQLHRDLAVEADKHVISKTQEVWDEQEQTNSSEGLYPSPTLEPTGVIGEARKQQAREKKRAIKEGRQLRTYSAEGPGVSDLMALVDLFISHPDDTSWWQPILSRYVSSHEAEVIEHIKQRNLTRGKRST